MSGQEVTSITPLGLVFTVVMGALLLALPRRLAVLPILLTACYMTFGQRLVVGGINLQILRLVVAVAVLRVLVRREHGQLSWCSLDTAVVAASASNVIVYCLQWLTFDALINRLGFAYNALGLYFVFRSVIRTREDVVGLARLAAWALLPLAVAMLVERASGRNPFFLFGGVPEFTEVREGRFRCQGPFAHPILAGAFAAALMPMFAGLWSQGAGSRHAAAIGFSSATLITVSSASSGPVASYVLGVLALTFWKYRHYTRLLRWSVLVGLVALSLVMKAPVWYLFARVNLFSGSTGWHRAYLIEQFINNFSEWWFLGARSTREWVEYDYIVDITNQFLLEGLNGGIWTLVLFATIFVVGFRSVGNSYRDLPSSQGFMVWSIGVALFVHLCNYLSVSYFDQNIVNWYMHLSAIAAISMAVPKRQPGPAAASYLGARPWKLETSRPVNLVRGRQQASVQASWRADG